MVKNVKICHALCSFISAADPSVHSWADNAYEAVKLWNLGQNLQSRQVRVNLLSVLFSLRLRKQAYSLSFIDRLPWFGVVWWTKHQFKHMAYHVWWWTDKGSKLRILGFLSVVTVTSKQRLKRKCKTIGI